MEQCIYCQSVYELEESDSTIPDSLCSKECEVKFEMLQESLEECFDE